MNICKRYEIECKKADEKGECTYSPVTESGMWIFGERFCDSEGFWHEHVLKQPPIDREKQKEILEKLFRN